MSGTFVLFNLSCLVGLNYLGTNTLYLLCFENSVVEMIGNYFLLSLLRVSFFSKFAFSIKYSPPLNWPFGLYSLIYHLRLISRWIVSLCFLSKINRLKDCISLISCWNNLYHCWAWPCKVDSRWLSCNDICPGSVCEYFLLDVVFCLYVYLRHLSNSQLSLYCHENAVV